MNNLSRALLTGICLLCLLTGAKAQDQPDSLSIPPDSVLYKKHSPVKASLFSMVVPGLGQAYNRKYWKIPLVYAGIGIPVYFARQEHQGFKDYRTAYRNRIAGDSTDQYTELTNDNLLDFIDIKRRNRDLLIIIGSVVYLLNIVDASVDAHFFYFDVSEDLSLHIRPSVYPVASAGRREEWLTGVRLTLNFN